MTDNSKLVKSISYSQEEIIQGILKLHCDTPIELDPPYSTGNFYKGVVEAPKYKFDLYPQTEDTIKSDARDLPLKNESINTIMFDPPFLVTKGKSLELDNDNNKILKRFGVFPTEKELFQFYVDWLEEFYRILKPNGVLIFKCQDKVSSGKQYFSHNFIMNEAERIGYYIKDIFILLASNRMVPEWQLRNQKHSRKFHSYFLVFEKCNRRVKHGFYNYK